MVLQSGYRRCRYWQAARGDCGCYCGQYSCQGQQVDHVDAAVAVEVAARIVVAVRAADPCPRLSTRYSRSTTSTLPSPLMSPATGGSQVADDQLRPVGVACGDAGLVEAVLVGQVLIGALDRSSRSWCSCRPARTARGPSRRRGTRRWRWPTWGWCRRAVAAKSPPAVSQLTPVLASGPVALVVGPVAGHAVDAVEAAAALALGLVVGVEGEGGPGDVHAGRRLDRSNRRMPRW